MIKEIAFVCYAVNDIKKSRDFYERVLGLLPTNIWEGENMGFIEYSFGPNEAHTFAIGQGAPNFKPGKQGGTVALEVDDFNASVDRLKENGVKFILEPHETGVCFMALFEDPDGNQVMLHKRKE